MKTHKLIQILNGCENFNKNPKWYQQNRANFDKETGFLKIYSNYGKEIFNKKLEQTQIYLLKKLSILFQ